MNRAGQEALLEGMALPASRDELVRYAEEQGASAEDVARLRTLPEREYRSIDEVGEELEPVQVAEHESAPLPRSESGDPPGGDRYTAA